LIYYRESGDCGHAAASRGASQGRILLEAHSISARQKAQIEAVANFEGGPYAEKEKLGFRLADRLHQGAAAVDDELYSTLAVSFSEPERIELFLTAAAFEMFPRFIDGLCIPSPAGK